VAVGDGSVSGGQVVCCGGWRGSTMVAAVVLLPLGAVTPTSVSSFPLVGLLFLLSLPYTFLLYWSQFSPSTFSSFLFSFLSSLCSPVLPFRFFSVAVLVCWWWRWFLSKPFFPVNVSPVFSSL